MGEIIQSIRSEACHFEEVIYSWARRTVNRVAHALAKLAIGNSFFYAYTGYIPDVILEAFLCRNGLVMGNDIPLLSQKEKKNKHIIIIISDDFLKILFILVIECVITHSKNKKFYDRKNFIIWQITIPLIFGKLK